MIFWWILTLSYTNIIFLRDQIVFGLKRSLRDTTSSSILKTLQLHLFYFLQFTGYSEMVVIIWVRLYWLNISSHKLYMIFWWILTLSYTNIISYSAWREVWGIRLHQVYWKRFSFTSSILDTLPEPKLFHCGGAVPISLFQHALLQPQLPVPMVLLHLLYFFWLPTRSPELSSDYIWVWPGSHTWLW